MELVVSTALVCATYLFVRYRFAARTTPLFVVSVTDKPVSLTAPEAVQPPIEIPYQIHALADAESEDWAKVDVLERAVGMFKSGLTWDRVAVLLKSEYSQEPKA